MLGKLVHKILHQIDYSPAESDDPYPIIPGTVI